MPNHRFFPHAVTMTLGDIADVVGADDLVQQDRKIVIRDVGSLQAAGPYAISVFATLRHQKALASTRAGAVIINRQLAHHAKPFHRLVCVENPRLAFAKVSKLLYPTAPPRPGIALSAVISSTAKIGLGTRIDPGAVVCDRVEIGKHCHIRSNAYVGDDVFIGDRCRVGTNSCITHCVMSDDVQIGPGSSIGSEGFGFVEDGGSLRKLQQLGAVSIQSGVRIGANCTIDRGTSDDTVIGEGSVLDNQVHIAHNVQVGRRCVICAQVGIAGSSVVGDGVLIGGQAGIADNLCVGDRARLAAGSGVTQDVPSGVTVGGYPASPIREWHRQTIGLSKIYARPRHSTS